MQTATSSTLPRLRGGQLVLATCAVSVGTLLITLDQFIANVSIPTIAGDLGVSQDNGSWVITSYTVSSAIMVPLTGWFTQLLGRVRLFALSAILFALLSLCCGLATSFSALVFFRIFQGAVSGSLIPLSQALLLLLFPTKKGLAMGLWGIVVMVGPALGPVVGGWITEDFSWRWIFNINVPLGIAAGIGAYLSLQGFESKRQKGKVDIFGLILLIFAVGSYQVVWDRGNNDDWLRSHFIVTLMVISVIAFAFFFVWESFHEKPIVDLSFFKNRNFSLGSLIIGLAVMCVFGNLVVGPIWVQAQLGYTPLWAGISIALFGASAVVVFPLIGHFMHLLDLRIWIVAGLLLTGIPYLYLSSITIDTPVANLMWPRFFQGMGFALFYVPLVTESLRDIPDEKLASAAGVFSFVRMLFVSSGVSIFVTFFSRREVFYQSRYVDYVIPANPQFFPFVQAVKEGVGLKGRAVLAFMQRMVMDQAFTQAFLEQCYLAGWLFIVLVGLAWFFRPQRDGSVTYID